MNSLRRAPFLLLVLASAGCFIDSISAPADGPSTGGAGGSIAASGGAGAGGGGGAPTCSEAADCGTSNDCVTFACDGGSCTEDRAQLGASCEGTSGKVCDGQGACLLDLGAACEQGDECAFGECADDVCCDVACDGPCQACGVTGACEPLPAGTVDPACAPGVCDAASTCAIGPTAGAFSISSTSGIDAWTGAVDAANRAIIGGSFDGTVTFDGTMYTATNFDAWVARYNEAGLASWGAHFGGPGSEDITGIGLAGGTPYVSGWHSAGVTIGASVLTVNGGPDGFVARLDPDTGAPLWSRSIASVGNEYTSGIAVDGDGNAIVVGLFDINLDLGDGLMSSAGGSDIFVLKLDPTGQPLWSRRFGGVFNDRPRDVAVRSDGSIVIGGAAGGPMTIGAAMLNDPGGEGAFVAVLSASGDPLFADLVGGFEDQLARFVAVGPADEFALVGGLRGTAMFGPSQLMSAGDVDVFAAVYNASFSRRWARRFGDGAYQEAWGARFDQNGNLLLVGDMDSTLDFGAGLLTSGGGRDAFVAKLAPDGTPLFSRRFGDGATQFGNVAGVGAAGEPFVIGSFDGTLDAGSGLSLTSTAGRDSYVIRLDP